MNPIKSLFASRKFILALVVTVSGVVLVTLGKLPIDHLSTFVGAVTLTLIAAISHEDAAKIKTLGSVPPPALPEIPIVVVPPQDKVPE